MMMVAEKKIALFTSSAELAMTANFPRNSNVPRMRVADSRVSEAFFWSLRQMPVDVLHHDYRCVDDQAEVDRADREQVGRFAAQRHDDDGKEQGKWDCGGNDDRAAQVTEKDPLYGEDQHDAEDQVMEHGLRGDRDELTAIVNLLEPDAGREDPGRVDFLYFCLDAADGRQALFAAPHQYNSLDDVVVLVLPDNAETGLISDLDHADILDADR